MNFMNFAKAVEKQFAAMDKMGPLYRVSTERDELTDVYLASWPEGTNPVFRKKTEHDCGCCKSFIRNVGNVVAIKNGKLVTIWDITVAEPAYQAVADAMAKHVRSKKICDAFMTTEKQVGAVKTFEKLVNGDVHTWNHFSAVIPAKYVKRGADIATLLGNIRTPVQMLESALSTVTDEALDITIELINQDLYRGREFLHAVKEFRAIKLQAAGKTGADLSLFCWSNSDKPESVLRFKNTVIGTLVYDLSTGVEIDAAVAMFESKVAPTNYKRPKPVATKRMLEDAKAELAENGYLPALERRFAVLSDININNVLFADRSIRAAISTDIFDQAAAALPTDPRSLKGVVEMPIAKFLSDVLPSAKSIELFLENRLAPNMVSLVAAEHPTAPGMFKWNNSFSWSYAGNTADAIKERVKAAGGSVEGILCCRLAWDYTDDLDFHMKEPPGGDHISFMNRRQLSRCGGTLDVDANGADGIRPDPCENIFYKDSSKMRNGSYVLSVNNYSRRSQGTGFTVQVECEGTLHEMTFDGVLPSRATMDVATIKKTQKGFEVIPADGLRGGSTTKSREIWGLPSMTFVPVNAVMTSPNHWQEDATGVGNCHYMFMLDKCVNDGSARPFFNEFLTAKLNAHRHVMELIGSKMELKVAADRQLSGVGISDTSKNHVIVRVTGAMSRLIKINF